MKKFLILFGLMATVTVGYATTFHWNCGDVSDSITIEDDNLTYEQKEALADKARAESCGITN